MRKLAFALACALFAAVGVFAITTFIRSDRTPPVISVNTELTCDPELSEQELLRGVEAEDAVDGDVTDSLVVESFTMNQQKGSGIVVYAARDRKNNVGKYTRLLKAPEGFAEGTGSDAAKEEAEAETKVETEPAAEVKNVRTQDVLAGFSGGRNPEQSKDSQTANTSDTVTVTVTENEIGTKANAEKETETESEEIQETNPGAPKLTLTQKSVTLKKGETFNPLAYVSAIEDDYDNIYALWQDIQITGEYDTTEEGTYTLYYYVIDSSGNMSNREKFTVVVE